MDVRASPALDTNVAALTLKVGNYVIHHGGLGVVRTLGRVGVPTFGVVEDRFAPAGLSRYATGRFVWPTGGQDTYQDQLLDGMDAIARRIGRPAVLIATDDHAAIFVATHSEQLQRWFLLPRQSPALVRDMTNKAALTERCRALGVPVPDSTVLTDSGQLEVAADRLRYPVVVKRCAPTLLADGRRAVSSRIVRSRADLPRVDTSSPVLLQEHIPSSQAEDWLFHGYCDATSECLVAFTGRKLRSCPADAGETAFGRLVYNPTLEQQARSLLRAIGYCGIVSMDYRLDLRDGTYRLLDFNPRVGAIFRLFQTDAGVDVIRALHLDLTGRRVPEGRPVEGRVVAVEGYDLRSTWTQIRDRSLPLWRTVSSWRTIDETAWFARDDVRPAVVALARTAVHTARRRQPQRGWHHSPPRYLPGRAKTARWM